MEKIPLYIKSHLMKYNAIRIDMQNLISLFRRKRYRHKYLEDIRYRFDQVRPVVSDLEVCLPDKPITPDNIGEALNGPHGQLRKEALFVQCENNKNVSLIFLSYLKNNYLTEQRFSVHQLMKVLMYATILMHGNLLHTTLQMLVIKLKVLILISPKVPWHIMTTL